MNNYNKIQKLISKMLSQNRIAHSLGVVESAEKLAERYGCDIDKVRLAAISHDCAKGMTKEELLHNAEKYNLKLDNITLMEPQLLHGPVGSMIAREELGIEDSEVLEAIRVHTTGKPNMSLIDKIIYLSDFIEPNRDYPGVEDLREIAMVDLDKAVLQAFDNTIKYVLSLDSLLHPRTIEARNYILIHINEEEMSK